MSRLWNVRVCWRMREACVSGCFRSVKFVDLRAVFGRALLTEGWMVMMGEGLVGTDDGHIKDRPGVRRLFIADAESINSTTDIGRQGRQGKARPGTGRNTRACMGHEGTRGQATRRERADKQHEYRRGRSGGRTSLARLARQHGTRRYQYHR